MILLDRDTVYAPMPLLDPVSPCTGTFSQDDLPYLKSFIDQVEIWYNKFNTDPLKFRFLAQLADLWTKVFNIPGGSKIEVIGIPDAYSLNNPYPLSISDPPPPILELGFLAEACTIFTLYKFQQQLIIDIAEDFDIDVLGKSDIYKALKDTLITSGFKKPLNSLDILEFNKMMNPDRHIGRRNEEFLQEKIKIGDTNPFIVPQKRIMSDYIMSGEGKFVFPTAATIGIGDFLNIFDEILTEFGEKIGWLLDRDSACAFRILSHDAKPPTNIFLACGDGTGTSGLFSDHLFHDVHDQVVHGKPLEDDSGVLLFNYRFDGTASVSHLNSSSPRSRGLDVSTVLHFTIYGLDHPMGDIQSDGSYFIPDSDVPSAPGTYYIFKDSKISVRAAGYEFIFKANKGIPITPVDGTEAGQARFDSITNQFYSPSGTALAEYDLVKRDLVFLTPLSGDILYTINSGKQINRDDSTVFNYDEISVSVNVVDGPVRHVVEFGCSNLFGSDVFVVMDERLPDLKTNVLNPKNNRDAIDVMIEKLINPIGGLNVPISFELHGHFVGEASGSMTGSAVEPDPFYQFVIPRLDRVLEKGTASDDTLLRYSYVRIVITDFNINIFVDSFVSARWSRLDIHLPVNTIANRARLDALTLYARSNNPQLDAYLVVADDQPFLPSYNPILSGLRSFGVAEALIKIIGDRATARGYDFTKINTMKAQLNTKLANAVVSQSDKLGIGANIYYSDYDDFRTP